MRNNDMNGAEDRSRIDHQYEILEKYIAPELGRPVNWNSYTPREQWGGLHTSEDGRIKELYLSGSYLTSLPAEIGKLENLEELYLTFNSLTSIPAEIGKLENLRGLYLSENSLTSIPAEIGKLENLRGLYLNGNSLTSIPPEIDKNKNLRF